MVIVVGGGLWYFAWQSPHKEVLAPTLNTPKNMKLASPAFENNQFIPKKYTCDGENINPPLVIKDVPKGAKSLVLIVDDPDAPLKTWLHWLVWNIEPSVSLIGEGQVPENAVQGINDFGSHSYGGPCPPSGIHHYHFKLYALDIKLSLDPSVARAKVETAMQNHILDKAELVGLYQRQHG